MDAYGRRNAAFILHVDVGLRTCVSRGPDNLLPWCAGAFLSRQPLWTQVSGTFRIVAKPLIEEIPVVAGMIVALKAPPEVLRHI